MRPFQQRSVLVLVVSAWLLYSLPGRATAQGVVKGTCVSATTGEPLSGAVVSAPAISLRVVADADGVFRLENVPVGLLELLVEADGYDAMSTQVRILFPGYERDLHDILLPAVQAEEHAVSKSVLREENDQDYIGPGLIARMEGQGTAYDLILRYRRHWLMGAQLGTRIWPVVFVNRMRYGDDPACLNTISVTVIHEIRFYGSLDAHTRYTHLGGVIEVTTK